MSELKIRIALDNDAFGDSAFDKAQELSRILTPYLRSIEINGVQDALFRDINGNTVGRAVYFEDDDE